MSAAEVESLKKEISETVESLSKKIEVLESKAEEVVGGLKETGQGIKYVVNAVSPRQQFEKHPWLCFGLSVAAGVVVGRRLARPETTVEARPSLVRPLAYGAAIIAAGQIAKKNIPQVGDEISALEGVLLSRLR